MTITLWNLLDLIHSFLIYLSSACAVGAVLAVSLLRQHQECLPALRAYLYLACAIAAAFSVSHFFVQVGDFASRGWPGMFDRDIAAVLLQTAIATAIALRLAGLVWISLSCLLLWRKKAAGLPVFVIALPGMFAVAMSFALVGHLNEQGIIAQAAVSIHVLAVFLWMGCLYPLFLVSRSKDVALVQQSMRRFGQVAVFIVLPLLLCGLFMASVLLETPWALFTSDYGRTLLVKLLLVCALLLLAAANKWWLVPRISFPGMQAGLKRSIMMEMCLGALLFLITAFLTTFVGP